MFDETIRRLMEEFGPPTVSIERWHVEARGGLAAPVTVSVSRTADDAASDAWIFCISAGPQERIRRITVREPRDIEQLIELIRSAAAGPDHPPKP